MAPSIRAAVALAVVLGTSAAGPARAVGCPGGLPFGPSPAQQAQLPSLIRDDPVAPAPRTPARAAAHRSAHDSAAAPARGRIPAGAPTGLGGDSAHRDFPRRIPSGRVRLSLAAAHATVLDPLASPVRYGGGGLGAALAFAHAAGDGALELSVEASLPRLSSTLTAEPDGPRESTVFTAARAVWLRRLGGDAGARAAGGGLLLGAEARFEGSLRDHRYREPALHFFYGLALASVGPAARWRSDGGRRGELSVEVAAPLLGMAYRPYCDLAYIRSGVRPRLAAPPALAALDAGAAWALPLGRSGARAVAEWRLAYLRYRDHDLYRSARQRLGVGLDLPTGYRR